MGGEKMRETMGEKMREMREKGRENERIGENSTK